MKDLFKKLNKINDPNDPYTQEDFDKEFNNINHTMSVPENFYKLKINFINKSNNQDPEYATSGSSGFDLRADLSEPLTIKSGKIAVVPTGLYFELPDNIEIQVRPRSGLAAKNGVTVLNTPGTVDSDYRGEIKIILINLGEEDFIVNNGDRIAQAVISAVTGKNVVSFNKTNTFSENTSRGSGGFGSTGLN